MYWDLSLPCSSLKDVVVVVVAEMGKGVEGAADEMDGVAEVVGEPGCCGWSAADLDDERRLAIGVGEDLREDMKASAGC